jgi:hypothetical protein
MNPALVEKIINAILYEGHTLYPYRPSALKNGKCANFGVIPPRGLMQTECLIVDAAAAVIDVKVRFLHLAEEGKRRQAVECEVSMPGCNISQAASRPHREEFAFPLDIVGLIELSAVRVAAGTFRVAVRISNLSSPTDPDPQEALSRSLVSTHTALFVKGGKFVSLLDPPEPLRGLAWECKNLGTWPVLVGEEGQQDAMLSSPTILYDYPSIAPETAGDLFKATEIDETLALRIMTLTEEEKREAYSAREHTGRILERTETLSPEHLLRLHAAVRRDASCA